MQNAAQYDDVQGRLLGFVRVTVGGRVFDLAVQAVALDRDGDKLAGGFFTNDGRLGILVEEGAPEGEVRVQIEKATEQAVRHLSQKYLN